MKMKKVKKANGAGLMQPENTLATRSGAKKKLWQVWKNTPFLIMLIPAILVVFLFNYLPIYGILIGKQLVQSFLQISHGD